MLAGAVPVKIDQSQSLKSLLQMGRFYIQTSIIAAIIVDQSVSNIICLNDTDLLC